MEQQQKPTRQDYMNKLVSHADYYRAIYREAHISYVNSDMLPRIKAALADGDEHLNTIPLWIWDGMSICTARILRPVFKAHGDFYSIAGGICAHKQAAIDAAENC